MSQSPDDDFEGLASDDPYVRGWRALSKLMFEGKSLSGYEANCCFLNVGGGQRFADVSSVMGLDHRDDGRAVAVTDWDHDGDLDLWVSNRTAPVLRFLRNDLQSDHRYLALKLVGSRTNRDAIGARVTIETGGEPSRRLVRTVRAGESFLGQSSKWVHVGLGETTTVKRLTVRWPGGDEESISPPAAGGRFRIVEGSGRAEAWGPAGARRVVLAESDQPVPSRTDRARVVLFDRVQVPRIQYRDEAGRPAVISGGRERPLLVNFWSVACASCVEDLKEYAEHRRAIERAGLDVVVINVDAADDEPDATGIAGKMLDEVGYPFDRGLADRKLIGEFEKLHRTIIRLIRPMGLPTSVLFDKDNHAIVYYTGPVPVERVLEDLELIDAPLKEIQAAILPMAGRWSTPQEEQSTVGVTDYITSLFSQPRNAVLAIATLLLVAGWIVLVKRQR